MRQTALADARFAAQTRWRPSRLPHWGIAAIAGYAAAALLVAGGYYYFSHMQPAGKQYNTQIGQREALTLADNSHVDIDADSAVSIALRRDMRLIHLERGQAYFQVAHDRTRPFIVEVNGQQVIATGTAFNVEAINGGVRVTLVEGHVVVRQAPRIRRGRCGGGHDYREILARRSIDRYFRRNRASRSFHRSAQHHGLAPGQADLQQRQARRYRRAHEALFDARKS